MEYEKSAKILKEILDLEGSPVAVTLSREMPEGIKKIEEARRHCQYIQQARLKGEAFYATLEEETCKGGAAVMGMAPLPPNVEDGSYYYKLGQFKTRNAARRTIQQVPQVLGGIKAILYAPLEKAGFQPDAIVVVCKPKATMLLTQAALYKNGGRIHTSFSGKQSLCADAVASPYQTGEISMTIGCSGSRRHAGIEDEAVIIGIPAEKLDEIVESLQAITKK